MVEVWNRNKLSKNQYLGTAEIALWDHVVLNAEHILWRHVRDLRPANTDSSGLAPLKGCIKLELGAHAFDNHNKQRTKHLKPPKSLELVDGHDGAFQIDREKFVHLVGLCDSNPVLKRELKRLDSASASASSDASSSSDANTPKIFHSKDGHRSILVPLDEREWVTIRHDNHWHRKLESLALSQGLPISSKSDLKHCDAPFENIKVSSPDGVWQNWGRTIEAKPQCIFYPRTVCEVQQVVYKANQDGKRLKVVGTSHSWSPMFGDDGSYFLATEKLISISKDMSSSDPAKWTITIGPGVTTGQLQQYFKDNDITVYSATVADAFSWGGIISTGSHGVGMDQGLVSDHVEAYTVVDSKSRVRTFSRRKHEKAWLALGCSFGLMGVIVSITMRVRPMRNALVKDIRHNMTEVFWKPDHPMALKNVVESHYATEVFWFPYNRDCWLKLWDFTDQPVRKHVFQEAFLTFEQFVQITAGRKTLQLLNNPVVSRLTPAYSRRAFSTVRFGEHVEKVIDAIHWQKFLETFRLWDMEFAMPVDDDFRNISTAWYDVVNEIERLEDLHKYPMNIALEMRFLRGSDITLAPAKKSKAKLWCYIEVITGKYTPGWEEFTKVVAKKWMDANPLAVPHWGKYHQNVPGIFERIKKNFGPEMKQFLEIRDKLKLDPENMFSNAYLDYVFDLVAGGAKVRKKMSKGGSKKPIHSSTESVSQSSAKVSSSQSSATVSVDADNARPPLRRTRSKSFS